MDRASTAKVEESEKQRVREGSSIRLHTRTRTWHNISLISSPWPSYHFIEIRLGIWIGGKFNLGTLDAGTWHVPGQESFGAQKQLMIVRSGIGSNGNAPKAVQV